MDDINTDLHFSVEVETAKRLDRYLMKVMQQNGYIRKGLKTKLLRKILVDFLDEHEDKPAVEL